MEEQGDGCRSHSASVSHWDSCPSFSSSPDGLLYLNQLEISILFTLPRD